MPSGTVMPAPVFVGLDANGDAVSGGLPNGAASALIGAAIWIAAGAAYGIVPVDDV